MLWITVSLVLSCKLLFVSALECYHMNKFGVSKLVTCRGYCASISAVVVNNNLAEVNYCVPDRRCLAELDTRQLADMGSLICRGLIESAGEGAITRCRAAVCQSDGCNNYNFQTQPQLNDCTLHQCSNAACHNPEELKTTVPPPGSSSLGTGTTPPQTEWRQATTKGDYNDGTGIMTDGSAPMTGGEFLTAGSEPMTGGEFLTAGSEPMTGGEFLTDGSQPMTGGEFVTHIDSHDGYETTKATTAANEITTKAADVTTENKVQTEKPETETAPTGTPALTTPTEKQPEKQTTVEIIETQPPTEEKAVTVEVVTEKEKTVTAEKAPVTDEEPTLDDFATETRGPPLVPTDNNDEDDVTSSYPPSVAEVTTENEASTEMPFQSTDYRELPVPDDSSRGATKKDQRITDVVDITRTPEKNNRNTKFKNFIGSSEPRPAPNNNEDYLINNSIDLDLEISNRDKVVRADGNSSTNPTSYLSLTLICFISALILV